MPTSKSLVKRSSKSSLQKLSMLARDARESRQKLSPTAHKKSDLMALLKHIKATLKSQATKCPNAQIHQAFNFNHISRKFIKISTNLIRPARRGLIA